MGTTPSANEARCTAGSPNEAHAKKRVSLTALGFEKQSTLIETRILGAVSYLPSVNTQFAFLEHSKTVSAGSMIWKFHMF